MTWADSCNSEKKLQPLAAKEERFHSLSWICVSWSKTGHFFDGLSFFNIPFVSKGLLNCHWLVQWPATFINHGLKQPSFSSMQAKWFWQHISGGRTSHHLSWGQEAGSSTHHPPFPHSLLSAWGKLHQGGPVLGPGSWELCWCYPGARQLKDVSMLLLPLSVPTTSQVEAVPVPQLGGWQGGWDLGKWWQWGHNFLTVWPQCRHRHGNRYNQSTRTTWARSNLWPVYCWPLNQCMLDIPKHQGLTKCKKSQFLHHRERLYFIWFKAGWEFFRNHLCLRSVIYEGFASRIPGWILFSFWDCIQDFTLHLPHENGLEEESFFKCY